MANNGYLVNGVCYPSSEYALRSCLNQYPSTYSAAMWITYGDTPVQVRCLSTAGVYYELPKPSSYNCEIEGPPLNSTQQLEAVNAIFPAILVALCVIWGVKQLYNTLISNPRAE